RTSTHVHHNVTALDHLIGEIFQYWLAPPDTRAMQHCSLMLPLLDGLAVVGTIYPSWHLALLGICTFGNWIESKRLRSWLLGHEPDGSEDHAHAHQLKRIDRFREQSNCQDQRKDGNEIGEDPCGTGADLRNGAVPEDGCYHRGKDADVEDGCQ